MAYHNSLLFLILFFITFICSSNANTFQVGGKDGWTLHPSENYNNWSGRLRFLINDTLHFKYDGGSDSVLVVNKGDYDGCNTNNPIMKLDGGDSTFKLDRSGPFYFISGNKSHCDQGQKLIVVVLALRNRSPPTTTPPSPVATPPGPKSPVMPPSGPKAPVSPPMGPGSPELSPSGTPVLTPPSSSPGGGSGSSPASSPGGGSGASPASSPGGGSGTSPTSSPGGGSGTSPASSPGGGSGSSPGGGSGSGTGQAPGPGGNNPAADVNTPPPPSAATPPLSGSIIASFVTMIFALLCLN